MVLLFSLAGCVAEGCTITTKDWTQAGIFDAFPPEGNRGKFRIYHNHNEAGVIWRKGAQAPDFDQTLGVSPADEIHWLFEAKGHESDEEAQEELRTTFETLGLPEPTPPEWGFRWTGC